MGRYLKINWLVFCLLVFIASRLVMLYQYDLAKTILFHHGSFTSLMCKWDCSWYLTIINDGYDLHLRTTPYVWKGLANWAFFPLYPYLVKIIAWCLAIDPIAIGIILNQIFVLIALILFYRYLKLFVDELNSRYGVVLLAFSPFSIYFASLYTEALFLLLSLLAFYFLHTRRYLLSAVCGGLLSATRPLGCLFAVVLGLHYLLKQKRVSIRLICYLLIAISGLLWYMLYLHYLTGDYLAFHTIQKGWGRDGINYAHIGKQFQKMFFDYHNSVLFLISIILSGYLIVQRYWQEALFNLLATLPGVLTGTMMSEGRFCGTLFTFYFAIVLLTKRSNSFKISVFMIFLLLYVSYFLYWMAHSRFLI